MIRVGQGQDLHRTDEGRPLVLGGVIIEEGPGLSGHSDADVLLHAITDAVLGAAGLGDIGRHFPPSDPRYRDGDSADFLRAAVSMAREAGWTIGNVDATVSTEKPRLAPYMAHIRSRIAEISSIDASQVNVKAKTAEGLDAIGRGEAMGAVAVCLLHRAEDQVSGTQ